MTAQEARNRLELNSEEKYKDEINQIDREIEEALKNLKSFLCPKYLNEFLVKRYQKLGYVVYTSPLEIKW